MAGRLVTKRGMTDREFKVMTDILMGEGSKTQIALRLRAWFTDLAVAKYEAGYQTGSKRRRRGSMKDHFDEDQG